MRTTLTGTAVAVPRARRATLVGTVFDGRFAITAKIAAGGFGAIYRAIDRTTGAAVALKVLHAELASDASLAARFQREGEMLAMLRDPRTVATYGSGEASDGTAYIVLELLDGESLDARVAARGTLSWREVLAIVRDVCSALVEAHAAGIVHRDLKPGNIFLSTQGTKVIDFGIAKLSTGAFDDANITRIGQALGTLDYMAPEQLVGGECDARTDLFTLGVVAYEAITGARPFADAKGATGLITALLTQTPVAPSAHVAGVPAEVDAIVLKLLEREPDDRFASAAALASAIDPFVAYDDEITEVTGVEMLPFAVTMQTPKVDPDAFAEGSHADAPMLARGSTRTLPRGSTAPLAFAPAAPSVTAPSARKEPVSSPAAMPTERPSILCRASRIAIAAAVVVSAGAALFAIT